MKKVALIVLVAMFAASPAMAAKKKRAMEPAAPAKIDSNEASWRLVKGSLPVFLPSWSIPIYLAAQEKEAPAGKKAKKAKR